MEFMVKTAEKQRKQREQKLQSERLARKFDIGAHRANRRKSSRRFCTTVQKKRGEVCSTSVDLDPAEIRAQITLER